MYSMTICSAFKSFLFISTLLKKSRRQAVVNILLLLCCVETMSQNRDLGSCQGGRGRAKGWEKGDQMTESKIVANLKHKGANSFDEPD
jgi:hypothetical protein